MLQVLATQTDPQVINAPEERPIAAWQQLYPDRWLLIEVTQEEDGEPLAGRLIAVAPEDMSLVPLWQAHAQQGKITAMLFGHSTTAGPTVVA
jgi:hypothetical protein